MNKERLPGEKLHLRVPPHKFMGLECGGDWNGAWFLRDRDAFLSSKDPDRCQDRLHSRSPIKFLVGIGAGALLIGMIGLMLVIYPPEKK